VSLGIDLLDLIQPLLVILVSALLLLVYFRRSLLTGAIIWSSFLAYFLAIAGKEAFQLAVPVPSDLVVAGVYYGLQTVFLEVGLAYVFARWAISRDRIRAEQAPAYGAALAFWENGVLLGVLAIPGLIAIILTGGSGLPGSWGGVLELVALGTVERVGSILVHFSWGILVVVAAASRRARYLLVALPMGFVDFLVPFAPSLGLPAFEGIAFGLALLSLAVTYAMTKDEWPTLWQRPRGPPVPLSAIW
jgi:hypothetical protein